MSGINVNNLKKNHLSYCCSLCIAQDCVNISFCVFDCNNFYSDVMKAILKIKNIINLRITICCLIGVNSLRFRANPNYLICMSMYIVFPFLSDVHSNEFEKSCPLFHLNQMIKEHSVWKFIIPNVSCLFFFEWEAIRNHYIIAQNSFQIFTKNCSIYFAILFP